MDNVKKHYEVLVSGDGRGNYPQKTIDVYCTPDELEIIARAMTGYVHNFTEGGCACVAKEGGGVSFRNFDTMFADCM